MKKGLRKVVLYLITFFTCIGVDVLSILVTKSADKIPFGENTVWLMFGSVVVGLSAEHFTKQGEQENGQGAV